MTDSLNDLIKIASMPGNGLGIIVDGGLLPHDLEERSAKLFAKLVPPEGLPIPEKFLEALSPFDKDKDGRLTLAEVDSMPTIMRHRVREAVIEKFGERQ